MCISSLANPASDPLSGTPFPAFRPPWWLCNRHIQTIVAARKPRRFSYGWTFWEELEIDLGAEGKLRAEASWQPGPRHRQPALILLHGLEGSARSHYLIGMSKKAYLRGFHCIRVNLRNCGGTEHLTPTLYCAALSQDILATILQLRGTQGVGEVFAAAVSLGANILLKFLGEQGEHGAGYLAAVAVVSVPADLALGARRLLKPENWLYQRHFVRGLIQRMHRKLDYFPDIADRRILPRIRSVYEFDDIITAPHFGFASADDYYRRASCGPLLSQIRVPTLLIQARDDPMIPFEPFSTLGIEENPFLRLVATARGGHAGFLSRRPALEGDMDGYWAEGRVLQFLSAHAGR